MQIEVALNAGFCFGVNRAINSIYELLDSGKSVCTLGSIIHNPQIIAETIENKKNSAESMQNRSIRWISHPLSGAEKARCARACGRGG